MKNVLLLIALSWSAQVLLAQTPASTIPEFSFEKKDGTTFTRKNIPDRTTFFVFFDTRCDHCQHAIEYLNAHVDETVQSELYLVTMDTRADVQTFLTKHGKAVAQKATLLFDTKSQFIARFKPRKYPSLMLYSKKRELLLYDDDEQKLPRFLKLISDQSK